MSKRVPKIPPMPPRTRVLSGVAVAGPTWKPLSQQANYIIGRGACVSPAWCPTRIPTPTGKFTIRIRPRGIALRRLYVIRITGLVGGFAGTIDINGTATAHATGDYDRDMEAFEFIEDVPAPTSIEQTVEITITSATSTPIVYGVAIHELPRAELQQSSASGEYGIDSSSCLPRMPITDADNGGVGGVARAIHAGQCIGRRAGLYTFAVDEADAIVNNAGSFTALFNLPVPILTRRRNYTSTTGVTEWRLWARCTNAGTTGQVRLTAASGDTVTIGITGAITTAFGLWPTPPTVADLAVDAEDVTTVDGRIAGAWDEVTIEAQRTAGTGDVEVAGIFCFEKPC